MSYRVVEGTGCRVETAREVRTFDSAYDAVAFMRRALRQRGGRPPPWTLLDPGDAILVTPSDLYDLDVELEDVDIAA